MLRNVHVGDLFDPKYLLEPLLLAEKCTYHIPETKIGLHLLYDSNKLI